MTKPLRLFSVEEFRSKAAEVAWLASGTEAAVWELARVCHDVHGIDIDPEAIIEEAQQRRQAS